jgi:hypothetical protein
VGSSSSSLPELWTAYTPVDCAAGKSVVRDMVSDNRSAVVPAAFLPTDVSTRTVAASRVHSAPLYGGNHAPGPSRKPSGNGFTYMILIGVGWAP